MKQAEQLVESYFGTRSRRCPRTPDPPRWSLVPADHNGYFDDLEQWWTSTNF